MYHIIDEILFDLSKMFMHYLNEATTQAKMNLPYGMVLTKIFFESDVNILLDEPKETLKHIDFYTLGTLTRMDFQKEEEKWTRKITSTPLPSGIPPSAPTTSTSSPSLPSMSLLPQFTSPPHDPYQTFQEPQPPMSYFEYTQALISSLSDTMVS